MARIAVAPASLPLIPRELLKSDIIGPLVDLITMHSSYKVHISPCFFGKVERLNQFVVHLRHHLHLSKAQITDIMNQRFWNKDGFDLINSNNLAHYISFSSSVAYHNATSDIKNPNPQVFCLAEPDVVYLSKPLHELLTELSNSSVINPLAELVEKHPGCDIPLISERFFTMVERLEFCVDRLRSARKLTDQQVADVMDRHFWQNGNNTLEKLQHPNFLADLETLLKQ